MRYQKVGGKWNKMAKQKYIHKNFSTNSLAIIEKANEIIEEYARGGMSLTLRQLYYQFVSKDLIPNKQSEYKRLGNIISDGRLAGLVDWDAIEDRTRNLKALYYNIDPGDAVADALHHFRLNKWTDQPNYVEVWIEKEALVGVIDKICNELDVPFFACKGYTSQSEMWGAAQRHIRKKSVFDKEECHIIHLGDHDPSGIDMTRDIEDRFDMFEANVTVHRIALNYDQIESYKPPPNPAKLTDTRAKAYIENFGYSSWELDALDPFTLRGLIEDKVTSLRDTVIYEQTLREEEEGREILKKLSENWRSVI